MGVRPGHEAVETHDLGRSCLYFTIRHHVTNATNSQNAGALAHTNPGWDQQLADDRITRLGLDPSQKAGRLSGGQRAQLALTLAIAKRPDLLILDEPGPASTRWPGASSCKA
jgi:ATPase subunit of ABC transporter with duplicated ATPase domains